MRKFFSKGWFVGLVAAATLVNLMGMGVAAYNATIMANGVNSFFFTTNGNNQMLMQAYNVAGNTTSGTLFGVDPAGGLFLGTYATASLPTCNANTVGAVAVTTDGAATPVYFATATNGGTNKVLVHCNGTNWLNG